jgi:hypothetical protein
MQDRLGGHKSMSNKPPFVEYMYALHEDWQARPDEVGHNQALGCTFWRGSEQDPERKSQ